MNGQQQEKQVAAEQRGEKQRINSVKNRQRQTAKQRQRRQCNQGLRQHQQNRAAEPLAVAIPSQSFCRSGFPLRSDIAKDASSAHIGRRGYNQRKEGDQQACNQAAQAVCSSLGIIASQLTQR